MNRLERFVLACGLIPMWSARRAVNWPPRIAAIHAYVTPNGRVMLIEEFQPRAGEDDGFEPFAQLSDAIGFDENVMAARQRDRGHAEDHDLPGNARDRNRHE